MTTAAFSQGDSSDDAVLPSTGLTMPVAFVGEQFDFGELGRALLATTGGAVTVASSDEFPP